MQEGNLIHYSASHRLERSIGFRLGLLVETVMSSREKQDLGRHCAAALLSGVMLFILAGATANGQTSIVPQEPQTGNTGKPDKPDFGSHESEMRARLIIKEEKKRYDEHLERAREVSQLASQLSEAYQARHAFSAEDGKKLERIEKLTKRIRNEAGGSETDADIRDIPPEMAAAVKRVAEMAKDLRKLVEKTPRHVISAAVIDQANTLIGMIQYVRNSTRQGSQ